MRHELKRDVLTIYLEGELNSFNADNMEKEIRAELEGKTFNSLVINFLALRYISSAGLRIILKLKQQYNEVSIEDCSLEVYDILSMTGFINIMPVKKALKRLYVSGAEVIGEGFFSTVYRIDKDTIVKVFKRNSSLESIERELKLAKQAFVLGVPTAISYDIVQVDDKYGVRFEMLDCTSLKNAFVQNPDQYDELVKRYIKLLKTINSTDCSSIDVPDMKEFFLEKISYIKHFVPEKYYNKAKEMVSKIPDANTFIHGDCHFKNIMIQGDDYLLIDMETLSRGNPIFELALIRVPYVSFEEDSPGNNEEFLGVTAAFSSKLYNDLVEGYFESKDQAIKDKLEILACIHMIWWAVNNAPDDEKRIEGNKNRLIKLLDQYDDLTI